MFWTAIGALTASWLMFMPALWPEHPVMSGLGAAAGIVALPLAVLGVASPRARRGMAWLGLLLGVGNAFCLGTSLGAIASYAVSAILLVGAGMAPTPERVAAPEALAAAEPQAPVEPETRLAA